MIKRFLRAENANAPVEAVIVIPFFIWGFMSMYAMTDTFIKNYKVTQSTYAIADAVAREMESIGSSRIEGLNRLHALMTASPVATTTRVSLVTYNADRAQLELGWSYATDGEIPLGDADMTALAQKLPALSNGESLVFVETWRGYSSSFGDLLGDLTMGQTAFSRLRYVPTIAWIDS
jgi:hypothetical protein